MCSSFCKSLIPLSGRLLLLLFAWGLFACSSPTEKAEKYYQQGKALLASGDLVKARLEFQNALQIKNSMTPAWYGLAQIAERQGDWKTMYSMLQKVVELDAQHLDAQIKLGRLYLAGGQVDKALETSNLTMTQNKDNAEVLALRASVMYKLDDRKAAVELANAALAKDANNIDALLVLANDRLLANDPAAALAYLDRGLKVDERELALQLIKIETLDKMAKSDQAEQVYRRLIVLYPDTKAFRHALVQFLVRHQRVADAEAELRAIVAANPGDTSAKLDVVNFVRASKGKQAGLVELEGFIKESPKDSQLRFAQASMYQAQGDDKAAEAVLRDIMTQAANPRDQTKAKALLAENLLARNERQAALALVEEILATDQRNEQALVLKASLEIEDGQLDQAIANLRTVLRDVPDSARAHLLLGKAHEAARAKELAGDHYARAFQASKKAPSYGVAYAEYLLRVGQAAQAEKVLGEVLKATPNYIPAIKLLAQARINQGDWAGAQRLADELRRRGDDKGRLADEILGVLYANRREFDQSVEAFKRVHASSPDEMQPIVSLVRAYMLGGKRNEALRFLDSVLKASPDNTGARLLAGQVYAASGEAEKAAAAFKQVIAKDPANPAGYLNLANLYVGARRLDDATQVIREGLRAAPGDFGLRMALAGVDESAGRIDDAIRQYEELLAKYPTSEIVANNLASLLSEHRSDPASLKRAYELAQRLQRAEFAYFKDTLGWASYKVGKFAEAVPLFESATAQMPNVPVFHYHLGMAYLARGDKDLARKELQKTLELAAAEPFPHTERARQALEGL